MLDFAKIAESTRAERARKRLSQEELAARMDRHRMTVGRAEDGWAISRDTIRRLERALGLRKDSLLIHKNGSKP